MPRQSPDGASPSNPLDPAAIEAIAFDYGNTLIRFDPSSVRGMNAALGDTLAAHYGYVDREALDRVRAADRVRPYEQEYRDNNIPEICRNLVVELYGQPPSPEVLDAMVATRFTSMLDAIHMPDDVPGVLEALGQRWRLGLLSNYPDGAVIRESMHRLGILDAFHTVVVSGDVGYIKPHPLPFEALSEGLGVAPEGTLYVGDNWVADVQGAKRFGMRAVLTTQYEPPETFEPSPGDQAPDAIIERLVDLLDVLGVRATPTT